MDLRRQTIAAMKEYFGSDGRRINHALKVLDYSNEILKREKADFRIVEAAAVLHDIGIPNAEKKHATASGKYQEIEGPPVAKMIMKKLDYPAKIIEAVFAIIANHHSGKIDTPEFRIIWDADLLVNVPEEMKLDDRSSIEKVIMNVFRTETGKNMAREKLISKV